MRRQTIIRRAICEIILPGTFAPVRAGYWRSDQWRALGRGGRVEESLVMWRAGPAHRCFPLPPQEETNAGRGTRIRKVEGRVCFRRAFTPSNQTVMGSEEAWCRV